MQIGDSRQVIIRSDSAQPWREKYADKVKKILISDYHADGF